MDLVVGSIEKELVMPTKQMGNADGAADADCQLILVIGRLGADDALVAFHAG